MIDPAAHARLERWKLSLLDLSTAARLLDVDRPPGSPGGPPPLTIPLPEVDPLAIAAALAEGAALALGSGPAVDGDAREAGRLRSPLARAELSQRLTAIRRAARGLADRGVHTLWLGLGMLAWRDADAASMPRRAPLALWPVDLVRAPGGLHLTQAPGLDPQANQALAERLRALGATLPDGDELDLAALLAAAEAIAAERSGWRVERGATLGIFDPARFTMWRDLDARGDELLASPLVAQLAGGHAETAASLSGGSRAGASFAAGGDRETTASLRGDDRAGGTSFVAGGDRETTASRRGGGRAGDTSSDAGVVGGAHRVGSGRAGGASLLDGGARAAQLAGAGAQLAGAAAELIAPLDADAGQLAAVAAAAAGASFVLQGPPGTGKSQTIANLIADAVAHGKTVLFVSDKAAALDTVHQRLAAVGLGEACLALHGQRAVRADVVGQLARVLERAFRPVAGPAGGDARLSELRAALDAHAAAMHRTGPFGQSLHRVLGRLIELRSAPCAPLAERDAVGLDRARFDRRRSAVEALAATAAAVEPVASHPWCASTLAGWPLDGHARGLAALDEAAAAAAELAVALRDVEQLVPGAIGRTRAQLIALGHLAGLAAGSPRPGAELLTHLRLASGDDIVERIALIRARGAGAIEPPRDPGSFLVLAGRHRALATEVNDRFTDSVAELDAPAAWAMLRRWARRVAPLRYLALRPVRAAIRAAAMPGMLDTDGAQITALESVIAERAARTALAAAAGPAQRWFGALGGDPLALDLPAIDAAVRWSAELRLAFDAIEVAPTAGGRRASTDVRAVAWRALVAQVAASPAGDAPVTGELAAFARLADAVRRWQPALAALAGATGIEDATLGAGDDHLTALRAQIERLRASVDALGDWAAFHDARCAARAAGVGPAIGAIERGDLGATDLATTWERATLLAWSDAELSDTPALAGFHGPAHHAHVAAFADLDRAMLALVRARALVGIAERVPRVTADPGGELAVLLHEAKQPRGHLPLRRLFAEIPTLLSRLAPCLLMSPQAVAQHLDPALPAFDLVVFDEASQLPTADAIGALARGHAAVVVGDSRQLPPMRWVVAGDPPDRAASAAVDTARYDTAGDTALDDGASAELDGLLEDSLAAGLPARSLTWHYRSRHEDLIAFASRHYYGDRLQIVPAAHRSPELGIAWRRVDGICDRATQQNRVEAAAVASEVIARLRDPAQRARSIAVIALCPAQQALIEDLVDAARADDDELDAWCEAAAEPLLIKDLDSVQGDERDVVLVSVGYGPDADGVVTGDLGALSQRGGERRLNVAITRAREQLLVFSSVTPEQLADAIGAPGGQGIPDLAALLAFARDGGGAARSAEDVPPASPVTAAIARALVERGWTVRHQVGCGTYKIDLVVVDPNDPERYVLAIEHDGATYAGVASARDRDRLRAELLGQLGWRVHRIWTLDWWADPEREVQRAHGAVIAAVAAIRQRRAPATSRPQSPRAAAGSARSPRVGASRIAAESARATGAASARAAATAPAASAGSTRGETESARSVGVEPARVAGPERARSATANGASPGAPAGHATTNAGSKTKRAAQPPAAGGSPVAAAGSGPTDAIAALIGDTAPVANGSAPIKIAKNTIAIGPYLAASIPAGRRAPDDLFAARHVSELGKIIEQVLAAEAPVHLDVLARRVGAYFGIGRLSDRVTSQVRSALPGRGQWGDEADVVWRLDQDPTGVPGVRVAGQGASARREIHEVPLAEVAAAARIVVERATGIAAGDLVRDAARLLGFARTTDPVVERVAAGVRLAAQRELIRITGGRATLPD